MSTVYEIIQGIAQAAANAYDGSHDERFVQDGKAKKAGLKREEGCPLNDSRVIDGFNVRFHGPSLIVSYQSEFSMKEIHDKKFESELESKFRSIVNFLKKEYKNVTNKKGLSLTSQGNVQYHCQNISQIRTWCQATKTYKIGGMTDVEPVVQGSEDRLSDAVKKWLAIGKDSYPGAKKPENITRKGEQ